MIAQADLIAEVARRPDRAGLFLDVDGTLAPIVARPELAAVLPEIPPNLANLAQRLAVVAVISGRPSAQVRELVDVEGVLVVGTHGLEDEPAMDAAILKELREVAATVGAWVEPKGAAAAVHFRAANGLEVLGGKRILELTPAGRRRKGGAVEQIARERGLEVVVFAGDDVGDLDAFEALGRLRETGVWTCGIASQGSETASAVVEAADLVVPGPPGVLELLGAISDAVGTRDAEP